MKRLVVFVLCFMGCQACLFAMQVNTAEIESLSQGMTADEVRAALGKPLKETKGSDGVVLWDYIFDTMNAKYVHLLLRDGQLAGKWKDGEPYPGLPPRSDADRAVLETAMGAPLTVVLEKPQADEAWTRVQVFIAKHSGMKIQTSTEFLIETYNPTRGSVGYKATRAPATGGKVELSVMAFASGDFMSVCAERNGRLLAHYAQTAAICDDCLCK